MLSEVKIRWGLSDNYEIISTLLITHVCDPSSGLPWEGNFREACNICFGSQIDKILELPSKPQLICTPAYVRPMNVK